MGRVATTLGETQGFSARKLLFESSALIPATNIQQAIEQIQSVITSPSGYNPTVVTFAMSPYTPTIADTVLLVDTTGGAVVIQMPLAAARLTSKGYLPVVVKDDVGNADVNAISVLRAGAETLDGLTTYPIDSKFTAVTFMPKAAGGYDAV